MNDARYEEPLARVLDSEITEPEAAELAEAARKNPDRACDLRRQLALCELYAQHVSVERSADAFVASCETRLRAEADSEAFAEGVETELLERSQAGLVLPAREPLRSRRRRRAGEWFERWRLGFALAGATAVLMAGFYLWQPIEGQPVLIAQAPGSILVERAGAAVPITEQIRLRPLDVLTVTGTSSAVITYGSENTHLELHPGARLLKMPVEARSGASPLQAPKERKTIAQGNALGKKRNGSKPRRGGTKSDVEFPTGRQQLVSPFQGSTAFRPLPRASLRFALGYYLPPRWGCGDFTLIELLVVLAVIAILASLLLPILGRSKTTAQSASCLNNLKQLQVALQSYADDHEDRFVPNRSTNENLVVRNLPGSWVVGNAQRDSDPASITQGALFSYVRETPLYRCPADKSTVTGNKSVPRLRTYALSGWLGSEFQSYGLIKPSESSSRFNKPRLGQVRAPAGVFAFIDEHEGAIDDGVYVLQSVLRPGSNSSPPVWFEVPTDRHHRGVNLSFVDGHVEYHPWRAPKRFFRHGRIPMGIPMVGPQESLGRNDLPTNSGRKNGSWLVFWPRFLSLAGRSNLSSLPASQGPTVASTPEISIT